MGKKIYKTAKVFLFTMIFLQIVLFSLNIILNGKTENNLITNSKTIEKQLDDISALNNSLKIDKVPEYSNTLFKTEIPEHSVSKEIWEKEIFTIEESRNRQYGDGPLYNQLVEKKYTSDPIKILIVGDGFSSGEFNNLSELTYPKILEAELNKKYPGLYKVSVLGDNLSSFLRQSDLLTKEVMTQLEPDLVILTYTAGRLEPNYNENKYCKEFNTCLKFNESNKFDTSLGYDYNYSNPKWRIIMCLKGNDNIISSLFRKVLYPYYPNLAELLASKYCTFERIKNGFDIPTGRNANLYTDPVNSPYYNDFLHYLSSTSSVINEYNKERDESGKRLASKYMVNLSWRTEHLYPEFGYKGRKFKSISGPLISKYSQYGFIEIPTPKTREMIGYTKTWEVGSIQGRDSDHDKECYYNCEISQSQMSKNIKNYLTGVIDHPLKFRPGILIQNAHAADLKEEILKKHPGISLSNPENGDILDDYGPWYISYRKIDVDNFALGYSTGVAPVIKNTNKRSYATLENSYCARINHPHALLSINNSFFTDGESIKVGYAEGEIENLIVVVERKRDSGERILSEAYLLKNNQALTIKYDESITGLYLGDNSIKCNNSKTQLKPFTATVGRIR